MKKILLLVIGLFVSLTINAQIKIKESFDNSLIIIGNVSAGKAMNVLVGEPGSRLAEHKLYCRIFKEKTTYGILVDTENSFDDDFEFALGTDIAKAKQSIEAILDFMKHSDINRSITTEDEDGRTIQINLKSRKSITLQAIDMQGAIIVNDVLLSKSNLERALQMLDGKAEEKVAKAIEKNKSR